MKYISKIQRRFASTIAGLAIAGFAGNAMADYTISTFDSDIGANTGTGGSVSGQITTSWSSQNAPSGPTGGSESVAIAWTPANASGWNDAQVNFGQSWPGLNLSPYLNLEFDIKVDPATSTLGPNGNYGGMQVILQGGWGGWDPGSPGWCVITSENITNTVWVHKKLSIAAYTGSIANLVFAFFSQGGNCAVSNNVTYLIDNVVFTAAPLPAPTLASPEPATPSGLTLLPCASGQWQRVMVYPEPVNKGTDFGWYGRSGPVTYSFTIADFPKNNDYSANIMLIPNAHMSGGNAGNTSIDWACTNSLILNFTANTNNPATSWNCNLSAKTNMVTDGGNVNYQILTFDIGQLPIGTWALTFENNTNVAVTAPGFTTNVVLPADVVELVSGNSVGNTALTPYFGIMPRATSVIGKACVVSHIQIQGVPNSVNDSFSTFDANGWSKLADYQPGIFVNNGDLMHYQPWNMPNDQGYTSLVVAGNVAGPYKDMGVDNSKWLNVNGTRKALVNKSEVHAALSGSETSAAFFRLVKRSYSKMQILLPGETAAPGTVTGKTGTPLAQTNGIPFDVVVNAVDADWYKVAAAPGHQITISSSTDGAFLGMYGTLSAGTVTLQATTGTATSNTITATDDTDSAIVPVTSSSFMTYDPAP